jgi:hypothetical protein
VSGDYAKSNNGYFKDESTFGPTINLLLDQDKENGGDNKLHSTKLVLEQTDDKVSPDMYPRNREEMRPHKARVCKDSNSRLFGKMTRILLWFLMLVSIPRVVHAQGDCVTLNSLFPDQASSTGCCQEDGITCVGDRITEMFVFHFNILVNLVCAP